MSRSRKEDDLRVIAERQEYIRSQVQHLNTMRSHQDSWISFARASGATWPEIAQALGVSAQAAEQRHSKWLARQPAAAGTELPEEHHDAVKP